MCPRVNYIPSVQHFIRIKNVITTVIRKERQFSARECFQHFRTTAYIRRTRNVLKRSLVQSSTCPEYPEVPVLGAKGRGCRKKEMKTEIKLP